jgi:transposase
MTRSLTMAVRAPSSTIRATRYRGDESLRRVIDVAVGILVGLRGYSDREAFDEIVRVVNQMGIGIGSLAAGPVALASGSCRPVMRKRSRPGVNCCGVGG